MKKITRVSRPMPTITRRKKVAAYARVSVESERMNHSLSAQISYYNGLIQRNPEWEFAGVYADDGISGTTIDKRKGFKQMLADCEAGKIDIILTKSIQRFAPENVLHKGFLMDGFESMDTVGREISLSLSPRKRLL